jgi:hypothetical protein
MKKLFTITSLLSLSILLWGCPASSKDDDPSPSSGGGSMTCDINGKSWKANNVSDIVSSKFYVNLAGYNTQDNTVIILFFKRAEAVTGKTVSYKFEKGVIADFDVALRKLGPDGSPDGNDDTARSGTFTFTKATKTEVEGTFTAITGKNISVNGKFSIKYTNVW